MYDFVKSKGYEIHRSWSQTDAGAGFWDKHRGQQRVWEQDVEEIGKQGVAESADIQPRAAGCVIVAADTGRWCLQQRSNSVSDPGVWSTWGGGREPGENLQQCVRRELAEESGYQGLTKLELIDANQDYATFLAHVPREFVPQINHECQDWRWSDPDDLPEPLHPGLQQTLGLLTEDVFNNRFNEIDQIVTQTHSKLIYQLLLQMFPQGREIIDLQYNDEDGRSFSEWRRIIFEIDQWTLAGPVSVGSDRLLLDPEDYQIRMQKYNQYIADKEAGRPARYFRNNDADPREINFSKLPPVTLVKTNRGLEVADGMHRAVLAKLVGAPLRAYVWQKGTNQHPNVAKIKSLFKNIQENFADGRINPKKLEILGHLKTMPLTVFGSTATKSLQDANDFDVFLDLDAHPEHKKYVKPVLNLSYRYYGWIDPFVIKDGVLYVRNDTATGWTRAKNAQAILKNIRAQGRPIDQITENFADGKKPGRKGLSKRVGIPKKASLSQLQKIASSSTGERRRMAQWQLNMRRGKAKKNK
jgi:8-oxo-dGTP pyrophosphatase MutT (NUDIX family)